jgi:hypothetical protein
MTPDKRESILDSLAAQVLRLGADELDIERKDGYEQVCLMKGPLGVGIARFDSSSPDGESLRHELYALKRKRRRLTVDRSEYEMQVRTYDSFGDVAFRVKLRPSELAAGSGRPK